MPDQESTGFSDEPLAVGQRIALRIEYDGSRFAGWQAQPQLPAVDTVQETLEHGLSRVAARPVRVHCAGRTDTGVHASAQWVHFDAPVSRGLKAWVVGVNAQLDPDLRVADACLVKEHFHARHSASGRRYDYLIANTAVAPALLARRVLWVRDALNAERMHRSLSPLLGENDFSAFRAAACQSKTPMRYLSAASVTRRDSFLRVRLEANAFLHHMVRNIVGSLIEVGAGRRDENWLGQLLAGRDRRVAAATAAPWGLYLTGVSYPEEFGLPEVPTPAFFPA
ncbi:MAG: tRNA pseudouridine(38-40) synthase TruA [Halieaceae bacterium]|nr:tRNA pseudouridine(38-40) synthase TruA [Halieaceae bacterium]